MATNQVNIGINVSSNGTTEKETKRVKGLKDMLDQTAVAANRASAAMAASRQAPSARGGAGGRGPMSSQEVMEYGRSRATGTGTGASARDFANQAQGLGGLVRVYATLAANIFAATAAFGALSRAMDTTNMVQGLNQLGAASGTALGSLSKRLVLATDGAVSLREAMEATVKASSAGLNTDQILKLGTVAKNASQALGLNMTDALSRLSRGISKLEPELLDELGIFVKIDDAASKYALSIGKSTAALTDFERRQAFANAVLDQGNKKFGELSLQANPYSKLAASLADLAQSGLEFVNKFLGPVAKILADNSALLTASVAFLAAKLVGMAIPALGQWREGLASAAETARDKARAINTAFGEAWTEKWESRLKLPELRAAVDKARADVGRLGVPQGVSATIQNYYKTVAGGTQISARQQGYVNSLIEKNTKAIQDLGGAQDRQSKAIRKAREQEIAQLQALVRLNQALKAASGPEAQFARQYENVPGRLMKPFTDPREVVAEREAQRATAITALSRVSANTLETGAISAIKTLNSELSGNVGNLRRWTTVAVGSFAAATTAAGLFASAISGYLMIAGLVVGAGAALLNWLSNTKEESQKTSEGFDRMSGAAKTASDTFEKLSKSKDPLAMMSVEGIQARATALAELGDSAAIGVSRAIVELEKMNNWAKTLDWFVGIFGSTVEEGLAKNLTVTIRRAFLLADENQLTDEARQKIEKILGTSIGDAKLPDILEKIASSPNRSKLNEIASVIDEIGNKAQISAAKGVELRESMGKVTTTLQEFTKSLKPADILYKVATDSTDAIYKLDRALKDPVTSLNAMVDASKNLDFLSTFPPEVAQNLANYGERLAEIRSELQSSEKTVNDYYSKLTPLTKELQKLSSGPNANQFAAQKIIDQIKKLAQETPEIGLKINLVEGLRKEQEDIKRIFERSIGPALVENAGRAAARLNQEFAKLKTSFGSFIADQLGGTKAGIVLRTAIEKQQIAISNRTLVETSKLSLTMEKLRLTTEESNLLAKQRKLTEQKTGTTDQTQLRKIDEELSAIAKRLGQLPETVKQIDLLLAGKKPTVTIPQVLAASVTNIPGERAGPGFKPGRQVIDSSNINQDLLRILQGSGELELQRQQNASRLLLANAEQGLKLSQDITKVESDRLKQTLQNLTAQRDLLEEVQSEGEYRSQAYLTEKQSLDTRIQQTSQTLDQLEIQDRINSLTFLLNETKRVGLGIGQKETANFIKELEVLIERTKQSKLDLGNNQELQTVRSQIKNTETQIEQKLINEFRFEEFTLKVLQEKQSIKELELDTQNQILDSLERNDLVAKAILQTQRNLNSEEALRLEREKELTGIQSQFLKDRQEAEKRVQLARGRVETLRGGPGEETTAAQRVAVSELEEALAVQERITQEQERAINLVKTLFGIREKNLKLTGEEALIQAQLADKYKVLREQQERDLQITSNRIELEETLLQKDEAILRVLEQKNFASSTYLQNQRAEQELLNFALEAERQRLSLREKFGQKQLEAQQRVDLATQTLAVSGGLQEEVTPQGLQLSGALTEQSKVNEEYRVAAELLTRILGIKNNTLLITQQEAARQAQLTDLYKKQDEAISRVKSLSEGLGETFGKLGKALGNFLTQSVEGTFKTTKKRKEIDEAYARDILDNLDKNAGKQEDIDKGIVKAQEARQNKLVDLELEGYQTKISGAKGFFKEHTAVHKALAAAEKIIHITRMAMWVKEMVMETTKTGTSVANSAARTGAGIMEATVDAGKAVIKAIASLPFPLNLAAGAATAAVVFGLLKSIGGKGNAPAFQMGAAQRQETQGTGQTYDSTGKLVETGGGVFGDPTAKSNSIARSLETIKENTTDGLGFDNRVVDLLTSIDQGINQSARTLYGVQGLRTGSMFETQEGSSKSGGILGLFSNKTTRSITDSGLVIQGTFEQLAGDTEGAVLQFYEQVTTTTKKWYGSTKTTIQTLTRDLQGSFPELVAGINSIFSDSLQLFTVIGNQAGIAQTDVLARLRSLGSVDLTASLRGLKGEELQQELNAVVGSYLDRASEAVFGFYKYFQEFGEGLLETVSRVTNQTQVANQQLKNIGLQSIEEVLPKVYTVGLYDMVRREDPETFKKYVTLAVNELVKLTGGLEQFLEKTNIFREKFLTETERLAPKVQDVNQALAQFGLSANSTRESFKDLVQSLDLSTFAGRQSFATLMNVAEAFDEVASYNEKILDERKSFIDRLAGLVGREKELRKFQLDQLNEYNKELQILVWAAEDEVKLIEKRRGFELKLLELQGKTAAIREYELSLLDDSLKYLQTRVWTLEEEKSLIQRLDTVRKNESNTIKSTINNIKQAISSLRDYKTSLLVSEASPLKVQEKYELKKTELNALADIINKTPVTAEDKVKQVEAASKFQQISREFLDISRTLYASSPQYTTDFNNVVKILDYTADTVLQDQLTNEEKQLKELESSTGFLGSIDQSAETTVGVLKDLYSAYVKGLATTTKDSKFYYDKLFGGIQGVSSTVLTFEQTKEALTGLAADDTLNTLIARNDTNSDGVIDSIEASAVAQTLSLIRSLQNSADLIEKLGTIVLTNEQVKNALRGLAENETLDDLIQAADTNSDGIISVIEGAGLEQTLALEGYLSSNTEIIKDNLDQIENLTLTYKQLQTGLNGLATNEVLNTLIRESDKDNNNLIDAVELAALTQKVAIINSLNSGFTGLDNNLDGKLSSQEFINGLTGRVAGTEISKLWAMLDRDNDSLISAAELTKSASIETADVVSTVEGNTDLNAVFTNEVAKYINEIGIGPLNSTAENTALMANKLQEAVNYLSLINQSNATMAQATPATAAAGTGGTSKTFVGKVVSGVVDVANSIVDGVGNVIKSVGNAIKKLFSDERLKKNISYHSTTASGINLYDFEYINPALGVGQKRGVLAQEVMKDYPSAVYKDLNTGFLKVNYDELPIAKNLLKFAEGGYAPGGLAVVGEKGPELVDFNSPGRVYTAEETFGMFNGTNEELLQEIRELRREVAKLREQQHAETGALIGATFDAQKAAADKISETVITTTSKSKWETKLKNSVTLV